MSPTIPSGAAISQSMTPDYSLRYVRTLEARAPGQDESLASHCSQARSGTSYL